MNDTSQHSDSDSEAEVDPIPARPTNHGASASEERLTNLHELRVLSAAILLIATIMGCASIYLLRPVLLPFILALFFVSGITPILTTVEQRLKAPRMVAVVVTLLIGFGLMTVVWGLVWVSVKDLSNHREEYVNRFDQVVASATSSVNETAGYFGLSSAVSTGISSTTDGLLSNASEDAQAIKSDASVSEPATTSDVNGAVPQDDSQGPFANFIKQQVRNITIHVSSSLMDLLSSGTIVLIFVFFLLLGRAQTSSSSVWREIDSQIRQYIIAKTVISAVTGMAFGVVLWFFGIPLATVFGLMAFLLNFIPNIGPIIASLLPIPLIILHPDLSTVSMVMVIVLSSAVQFVSGNMVEPKLMGDSFDLDPIAILLALMFWGMIWGIVGMLLATPILAASKILLEKFDRTKPLAHLMAGRMELVHLFDQETQV